PETAKTRKIYMGEEEKTAARICVHWERFLEHDFKKEMEKGVFARELTPKRKVYTVEQTWRIAFIAFITGVVSEDTEQIKIKIERLRE
ncbi:unnamed protein product, partial [marine sediment metagenome]